MKKHIELIYKILIVIITGIGLYLNFDLFSFDGGIIYFTIQSSLLCFLFYLITVILIISNKLKKNNFYYIFKGVATMAITITMFVYQFLLAPNGVELYEHHFFTSEIVHLAIPILIILDYFLFAEKGNIKKTYPLYWCSPLFVYLVFVIIYSLCGGTFNGERVPYFFLDIKEIGFLKVLIYCFMITIFYIGCGHLAFIIDNKLSKKNENL